jgi:hypothetical protein
MESIVPVNLLLAANTVQLVYPNSTLEKMYDLKGSWNNRITTPGENQTKKDRNFLQCKHSRLRSGKDPLVNFNNDDICSIMENVEKDTLLLMDLELMDYSVLFGVEVIPEEEKKG